MPLQDLKAESQQLTWLVLIQVKQLLLSLVCSFSLPEVNEVFL